MKQRIRRKGRTKKRWNSKSIRKMIKRLIKRYKSKTVDDPNNKKYELREQYPESFRLKDYDWQGMLTLKFHSYSYSKDDLKGEGQRNRFAFVEDYMNNLRNKFKISDREFIWVACEEFGKFGMGHIHVIFSFDFLRDKHREDKIPRIDFSEDGQFAREANESKDFICRKFDMKPKSLDVKWSPKTNNRGLVDYLCKVELGANDKKFIWSKFWESIENCNLALT